jgi:hypothetical protein
MSRELKGHREPKSARLARRSFLKAVGVAATMLPFYKMLEDSVAHAQSGQLPLKFVGVGAWHGTTQRFYARQPGETDQVYDISYPDCCLRPFDEPSTYGYSFKDKIIIFEAFDYGVGRLANQQYYPGGPVGEAGISIHGALALFLTGSAPSDGIQNTLYHTLQNASLDQYLAGLYGGVTPFRSIELTTQVNTTPSTWGCLAAGEGGALLSTMTSPEKIWDRFFASLLLGNDPAALAAAAQKRAVGKSVLDFAIGDLQRLDARLAGAEKQKLDQHLTAMRDLEKQLTATVASCAIPPRHAETGNANPADNYIVGTTNDQGIVDLDRVANMQIDLLAQILICDLTRFGTIVLPNFGGAITGSPQIPNLAGNATLTGSTVTDISVPADFHLEIAHKQDSGDIVTYGKPLNVYQAEAAVQRYFHGKVARLMQHLEDAGVLDNTVILIGNEGGMGATHQVRNVPIVMAGGANGALQMGRRIVAPGRVARPGNYATQMDGSGSTSEMVLPTSHNPILVAVANVFRAAAGDPPINSYGTCSLHPEFLTGVSGLI